ncbi:hypothetical protein ACH5RR_026711 [Cinchona calisaya]|uniref:Retrotransposon gag domain-containing protein n=1 Tax=Cinchona calisaya TaxID=153742 RepID=A0ABD2Z4I0_9GENT
MTATSRGGSSSRGELNQTTMSLGEDASHHSFQLTSHKLDGRNYLEWAQSVKLAIDGRGKLGHLTGKVKKPEADDPWMSVWQSENSLISAWLINSMELTIGLNIEFDEFRSRVLEKKPLPTLREAFLKLEERKLGGRYKGAHCLLNEELESGQRNRNLPTPPGFYTPDYSKLYQLVGTQKVMERAQKRKNVDTATGTGDDEIHDAEIEVPIINLVHGSRNAASRVDQALNWIAQIENQFKALRFPEDLKVQVVISFSVGDAENWWRSMEPMIDVAENDVTWKEFKEMFLDQYFPRALRKKMQNDFYSLRQTGNMTVLQYANKFIFLGRFCPKVFEDEVKKMDRFEQAMEMRFKLNEGQRSIGKKPSWMIGSSQAARTRQQGNFQNANTRRGPINAKRGKVKQCKTCQKFHREGRIGWKLSMNLNLFSLNAKM